MMCKTHSVFTGEAAGKLSHHGSGAAEHSRENKQPQERLKVSLQYLCSLVNSLPLECLPQTQEILFTVHSRVVIYTAQGVFNLLLCS